MLVEVKPFAAQVDGSFLNPAWNHWIPCRVFAVNLYPGHFLTFTVWIDGAVYSYLPLHAFKTTGTNSSAKCATVTRCPDSKPCVTRLSFLEKANLILPGRTVLCEYLFTVDWFEETLHVLESSEGLFAYPNRNILFNTSSTTLPDFKSNSHMWR